MIAREIIDLCGYRARSSLWLSALNDASIRKALRARRPPRRCRCNFPAPPDRVPTG